MLLRPARGALLFTPNVPGGGYRPFRAFEECRAQVLGGQRAHVLRSGGGGGTCLTLLGRGRDTKRKYQGFFSRLLADLGTASHVFTGRFQNCSKQVAIILLVGFIAVNSSHEKVVSIIQLNSQWHRPIERP